MVQSRTREYKSELAELKKKLQEVAPRRLFEVGDCLIAEARDVEAAAAMKLFFQELHQLLEAMKSWNLELSLKWAAANSNKLKENGSDLQLRLHLQFLKILQKGSIDEALKYARTNFVSFAGNHMAEIQKLMGCLFYSDRLHESPYAHLFSPTNWDRVTEGLTRQFCNLLGQSYEGPLSVTIAAGIQGLPPLLKFMTGNALLVVTIFNMHTDVLKCNYALHIECTIFNILLSQDHRVFIGGDFNGHIGSEIDGYDGVHGGFGFGSKNEEGRTLLEFATAHDMLVFPEEACASQHILLVLVFRVRNGWSTHRRAKLGKPRIFWKKLHGATTDDFRSKVLSNTGKVKEHKGSWWWNDEVQTKMKTKQTCFKEFLQCNDDEERSRAKQRYKEAKREAKKTVAKAKDKAYEEMYKILDTKKRQNDIFRLAKSRENRKKDLGSIGFIKDNNCVLLMKDHDIKRVWGSYFFGLFNDGASPCRDMVVDGLANHHTTANNCPTSRIEFEEAKMALRKMGRDKAVGPDQIPITVWLALGEERVKWLTKIFNIILETAKMPEEWRESTYQSLRIKKIPNVVATTKAYDSVPRDTIWKTLEMRRIPTAYIREIRDMYCRSTTYVRTTVGDTEAFPVEIRLHKGSTLSPYIFALIMEDIFFVTPDGVPWCMLFADDIVLVAETKTELNSRLATWKTALEEKGLRINIEKTKYLCSNFSGNQNDEDVEVCIEGHVLPSKDCFKYLGSMIHKDGGVDDDVTHRIKAGWIKWRAAIGVLCDKKVPQKLKGKFYRMSIRPALLYGSECWEIKKDHVRRMKAAEMRMLRWAYGRTLWDMTPNSTIRMSLGMVSVSEKLMEGRLRWFGHVLRRKPSDVIRRVDSITVDGPRRRGRPRRKWEDCLRFYLKNLALTKDMTSDRKVWRLKTSVAE
ncbi:Zinc finger family protein, putative isoform 1 [Hibiscus syriacus]|uniref:Zinc finger family protein, putative isoform 1 n=1 Tax=Hibiscus syriacus TaxID=106335 RepID=A0A6A3BQ74_HIBSY|nr:Zinc finger family protein, putative isoform 1 [Hibiscus syriacus]